jgi:hypothetical protein
VDVSEDHTQVQVQVLKGIVRQNAHDLNFNVLRPGDYNGNGAADVADYVLWRNTVGSTTDFRADGTGPAGVPDHVVSDLDYQFWRSHFGEGAASATSGFDETVVPESAGFTLASLAAITIGTHVARRRRAFR